MFGFGGHGFGLAMGPFEANYRCYPVTFIDKPDAEKGDKIFMPPSALDRLCAYTSRKPGHPLLQRSHAAHFSKLPSLFAASRALRTDHGQVSSQISMNVDDYMLREVGCFCLQRACTWSTLCSSRLLTGLRAEALIAVSWSSSQRKVTSTCRIGYAAPPPPSCRHPLLLITALELDRSEAHKCVYRTLSRARYPLGCDKGTVPPVS